MVIGRTGQGGQAVVLPVEVGNWQDSEHAQILLLLVVDLNVQDRMQKKSLAWSPLA